MCHVPCLGHVLHARIRLNEALATTILAVSAFGRPPRQAFACARALTTVTSCSLHVFESVSHPSAPLQQPVSLSPLSPFATASSRRLNQPCLRAVCACDPAPAGWKRLFDFPIPLTPLSPFATASLPHPPQPLCNSQFQTFEPALPARGLRLRPCAGGGKGSLIFLYPSPSQAPLQQPVSLTPLSPFATASLPHPPSAPLQQPVPDV